MTEQLVVDNALKRQIQSKLVSNVFEEDEFKEQFLLVFEYMANILSKTLGPYGASTMIDQRTNYAVTKDGFRVLANLRFGNERHNRIYSTLFNISFQMVAMVGDGSTSAVVAAYTFLKEMLKKSEELKVRPKDLNKAIQDIVVELCGIIAKKAKTVNDKNLIEVVENIVRVATNDNDKFTELITGVYKNLGPTCDINIIKSPNLETKVYYEDGMYSNDNYLVDSIYHNRGNTCFMSNPKILMFDTALEPDIFDFFTMTWNNLCAPENTSLVIIAPFYDQYLMDKIRKDAETVAKRYSEVGLTRFPMVFLKSNLTQPIQKEMYRDLAALLGATIIQPPEIREITKLLNEVGKDAVQARLNKQETDRTNFNKVLEMAITHIGTCEEVDLGDKRSSFKGFTNKNATLYEAAYRDAEVKLNMAQEEALSDTIDDKLYDAKTRFSKIKCKSATIEVGGANRLEMELNYDSVDDAVKATRSAIQYGYNVGCNIAIIKAIEEYRDYTKINVDNHLETVILDGLTNAFKNVIFTIYKNGMSEEEAKAIVEENIRCGNCWDMNRHKYDEGEHVINSARTDIEILRGAIAMVAIVLTCNQYLSTTMNV